MVGTAKPQGAVHMASKKMAPVMRTELKASERASIADLLHQHRKRASSRDAKKPGIAAKAASDLGCRLPAHLALPWWTKS
jgi:hypothetical protein